MLLEFSQLNIKLRLPLIFPIFNQIEKHCKKAYVEKDNQLFKTFRYFLSYIFASIFLLLFKIRNRKNSNDKTQSIDNANYNAKTEESYIDLFIKKNERKNKLINILFLSFLCIIGIFCQFYRKLFEKEEYRYAKQSVEIFFQIISLSILSLLILNQKLYKHHFISLGIITFLLLILFIVSIPFMEKIFESFIYYIFYAFSFSFYDILKKKYMNIYYHTPYFIMCIIGLVNVILLLVFELITYYSNPDISGIFIGFNDNIDNIKEAFLFILDLIMECIWNLGFWLTIYYFSPCYNFISEYIAEYILYISNTIEENDKFYSRNNVIIFSICFFINCCCILVFNEVVILNFWGLDFNTKKRIEQREKKDSDISDMVYLRSLTNEEDEKDV